MPSTVGHGCAEFFDIILFMLLAICEGSLIHATWGNYMVKTHVPVVNIIQSNVSFVNNLFKLEAQCRLFYEIK